MRPRVGLDTFFFCPSNFVACHQASATFVMIRDKLNAGDQPRYVDYGPTQKAARVGLFRAAPLQQLIRSKLWRVTTFLCATLRDDLGEFCAATGVTTPSDARLKVILRGTWIILNTECDTK